MPRFLMAWILGLAGTAIGLIICAFVFGSDFSFGKDPSSFSSRLAGFVLALVVFAVLNAITSAIVLRLLVRHAGSIVALTGLISTIIALLLTALTPWMNISGFWTWVWSVLIIWVLGMFIWVIPGPWRNFRRRGASPA